MGEKYRENFCLDVVLSRQIQLFLCVDFNKNKYEGAFTQSAAKELGTLPFGNQLIFLKWFIVVLRTPKNFEFRNSLELSGNSNSRIRNILSCENVRINLLLIGGVIPLYPLGRRLNNIFGLSFALYLEII